MSDFSRLVHNLGAIFLHAAANVPAVDQPTISVASAKVAEAAAAVDAVVPVLAKATADTALATLGPIGVAFAPVANAFIDALIAELSARKQPVPEALTSMVAADHPVQPG